MSTKPFGRPKQYTINGSVPLPPSNGWQDPRTHTEQGRYLICLIKAGLVTPSHHPVTIWKSFPPLRVVHPKKFARFVRRCREESTHSTSQGEGTSTMPRDLYPTVDSDDDSNDDSMSYNSPHRRNMSPFDAPASSTLNKKKLKQEYKERDPKVELPVRAFEGMYPNLSILIWYHVILFVNLTHT